MDGKSVDLLKIDEYLASNEFKSEGRRSCTCSVLKHGEVVVMLLSKVPVKSAVVNPADDRGFTPLFCSERINCLHGSLLDNQANVNRETKEGSDGCNCRRRRVFGENGHVDHVGAKVSVMSNSGTPLHWAAGKGIQLRSSTSWGRAEIETTEIKSKAGMAMLSHLPSSWQLWGVLMIVYVHCWRQEPMVGTLPAISPLHICAENRLSEAVTKLIGIEDGAKYIRVLITHP